MPWRRAGLGVRRGACVGGLLLVCALGCGGAPARMSDAPEVRARDLERFGRALLAELRRSRGAREPALWLSEVETHRWFDPRVATVWSARRAGSGGPLVSQRGLGGVSWASSRFAGLCVQGLRRAEPGGAEGFARPAWLFERMLLVARRPGGDRVAAWVEGTFLWTPRGWRIAFLEGVEAPRWEHADLDLARCDLSVGRPSS